jgi:outer membrane protein assembly factor BamB
MHHGDEAHTGYVSETRINRDTVSRLALLHELVLDGPVLSTPAVVDGCVYVGVANSRKAVGQNGGAFYKIDLATGRIAASFRWDIPAEERDSHGFCGMGCTPAIRDGRVYFSAFNGKLYCLAQADLTLLWVVDLRYADPLHAQPVTNDLGAEQGYPPAAGWSSPVVVDGRVFVGIGEGENPFLYGFVYCLDAVTGRVVWIFCTCQFEADRHNRANELPAETVRDHAPPHYTLFHGKPVVTGCSVWGSIAYDHALGRLYCPTGNPVPDSELPSKGYSNGVIALDARTGALAGFAQFPAESSYRVTDIDVDVGGSPTLFDDAHGRRLVGLGCKNGAYMVMDARSLEILSVRQMLPHYNDGSQIPTVDPHGTLDEINNNVMNPVVPNEVSNRNQGENYCGTYSTGAFHAGLQRLFVGLGGNNYHPLSPGIDTATTPFLRALAVADLRDAWPLDDGNPRRYRNGRPPFYTWPKESGLALPAIANDVVFMTTSRLALYAFSAADGTLLWQDLLGDETGGVNGGYGYCLGPAIYEDYVVTGSLLLGQKAGSLRIYALPEAHAAHAAHAANNDAQKGDVP